MNYLFDNALFPLTAEAGFLKCDPRTAVEAFMDWQASIERPFGWSQRMRPLKEPDLEQTLRRLLPRTTPIRMRKLFIGTHSDWTAYFDNGRRGPDPVSTCMVLAKKIDCWGVRVAAHPRLSGWSHGAAILEVYNSKDREFLNYIRSISLVGDANSWSFDANGEPFDFEDLERYKARHVRDRFDHDLLRAYVTKLGIVSPEGLSFNDEGFYRVEESYLIEKKIPFWSKVKITTYDFDEP